MRDHSLHNGSCNVSHTQAAIDLRHLLQLDPRFGNGLGHNRGIFHSRVIEWGIFMQLLYRSTKAPTRWTNFSEVARKCCYPKHSLTQSAEGDEHDSFRAQNSNPFSIPPAERGKKMSDQLASQYLRKRTHCSRQRDHAGSVAQ